MNNLQNKLLEMFSWLHKYLVSNGLRYYIVCGTMLGAVRHKGFIPWDDDIDIGMPRADYEKLIELLKNPVDHYVVESPESEAKDYLYQFAKFYDINTTLVEDLRKKVKRGIYIDIFPLDGMGNTFEESKKNYKKIDKNNMLLAMKVCKLRKERKWWKNAAIVLGRVLPINSKRLAKKINRISAEHDFDNCEFVCNPMSTYRDREIMRKDIYGVPTEYEFEGLKVYGPEKYDEYLTTLFKNWRELPPEDKRYSPHDLVDIDYEKSYMHD